MNNNTSIEAKIKKIMFAVDAYSEDDRYRHVLYREIRMALTDTSRLADFGNTNPVLFDLTAVISWLESGCDPLEAAKELRIYQKIMQRATINATEALDAQALPKTMQGTQP